jgi:sugar phosphate isomerase/epimerase
MHSQPSLGIDRRTCVLAGAGAMLTGACSTASVPGPAAVRRVLWAANVRNKSLADRIVAAQVGGFTHMSLFPIDYRVWRQQGLSAVQIRAQLRSGGVKILAVDPFVQWTPGFATPKGYPADYVSFIDFSEAQVLEMAQEVEAEAVNCVEGLGQAHPMAALVDHLGRFADRAHERGLRVTFEFMPISSVPDLAAGWALVSGANRANLGLCFDTWHYFRSKPDDALLLTIPGAKVFEIQLADAMLALQGRDLTDDLLRFRRLPGEGELPIGRVVPLLKQSGAWRSVGPEVFADAMDALDAREAGRRCGASTTRWLSAA